MTERNGKPPAWFAGAWFVVVLIVAFFGLVTVLVLIMRYALWLWSKLP